MSDDNDINDLEVEITDLEPIGERSSGPLSWLATQSILTKTRWRQVYTSSLRALLLIAIFLVPLAISTSYGPERIMVKNSGKQNCIVLIRSAIDVIVEGTATPITHSSYVTAGVITITTQSSDGSILSSGSTWSTAPSHGCR